MALFAMAADNGAESRETLGGTVTHCGLCVNGNKRAATPSREPRPHLPITDISAKITAAMSLSWDPYYQAASVKRTKRKVMAGFTGMLRSL